MRKFNMWLRRHKFIFTFVIAVTLYIFLGIGDHIQSKSYDKQFDYPLNIDIVPLVNKVLRGETVEVQPVNKYPYKFNIKSSKDLIERSYLAILVKSSIKNFERRNAIRQTWGSVEHLPSVTIKLAFFLGMLKKPDEIIESKIKTESEEYNDIVQCDFIDDYFNNTIKTMMEFRWAYETWPNSTYYLFSDDDMYVSINNLNQFLEDSNNYPENTIPDKAYDNSEPFYVGYKFESAPHRHITSKWLIKFAEYPYDKWPPYITAGAFVTNNKAMKILFIGSWFVRHFRFDDIYLGIVAKKTNITPHHSKYFSFYKMRYTIENYKNIIASHGYEDPSELINVWNQQKVLGYA